MSQEHETNLFETTGGSPPSEGSEQNRYSTIPTELREIPHWVAWRPAPRANGKVAKIPLNPNADQPTNAAVNDSSTWGTCEQAVVYAQRNPGVGIGFVFTADLPYAAVDLDDCRDPETGSLAVGAWEIIQDLDSYTEVSQSGRGLHILVKGTLPPGRRSTVLNWGTDHQGKIEIYDQDHFFAPTGHQLTNTPDMIEARQEQLTAVYQRELGASSEHTVERPSSAGLNLSDVEVIALARSAANGELFNRLWAGDTITYGGDESAADQALCDILGFWTKDPDQIDRLFRQSGLMRPKWDESRGEQTYGELTISRALERVSETYTPGTQPSGTDFRAEAAEPNRETYWPTGLVAVWKEPEPKARPWRVQGLIPEGAPSILYGDGGLGKSYLGLYVGTCVAAGLNAFDLSVTQGRVLYLDTELDHDEFQRRAYEVARGLGLQRPPTGLFYYRLPGSLVNPYVQAEVEHRLSFSKARFSVLDSLSLGAPGADVQHNADAIPLMAAVQKFGTVLAIDHQATPQPGVPLKQYRPFGSVFKRNAARSVIQVTPGPGGVILRQDKNNFGPLVPPFGVSMKWAPKKVTFARDGALVTAVALSSRERVAAGLRQHPEGIKPEPLASELDIPLGTVRNNLGDLKKTGSARNSSGVWYPVAGQSKAA